MTVYVLGGEFADLLRQAVALAFLSYPMLRCSLRCVRTFGLWCVRTFDLPSDRTGILHFHWTSPFCLLHMGSDFPFDWEIRILASTFLLGAISRPFQCLKFGGLFFLDSYFVDGYFFSRGSSVPTFVQREGEIISD